jgi:hypothetical protein
MAKPMVTGSGEGSNRDEAVKNAQTALRNNSRGLRTKNERVINAGSDPRGKWFALVGADIVPESH